MVLLYTLKNVKVLLLDICDFATIHIVFALSIFTSCRYKDVISDHEQMVNRSWHCLSQSQGLSVTSGQQPRIPHILIIHNVPSFTNNYVVEASVPMIILFRVKSTKMLMIYINGKCFNSAHRPSSEPDFECG